jgi:hypothetical protein
VNSYWKCTGSVNIIHKLRTLEDALTKKLNKTTSSQVLLLLLTLMEKREEKPIYVYKQGWKSIHKKYKACQCKCRHSFHQNSSNEEDAVSFFSGLDNIWPKTSPQATFPLWQNYGLATLTPSEFAFECLTSCTS